MNESRRFQTVSGVEVSSPPMGWRIPPKGFQDHPSEWYEETGSLSEDRKSRLLTYLNQLATDLDGTDIARWEEWGIVDDTWSCVPRVSRLEHGRSGTRDVARWRLCLELRWSNPIRLSEGVEHLQWLKEHFEMYRESVKDDPVLCLYLGAALEMRGGEDGRALQLLTFPNLLGSFGPTNELLWRACLSRLYRRTGNLEAAKAEEETICSWIRGHPYALMPSVVLRQLRTREETRNPILERLGGFFDGYREYSRNTMSANGILVQQTMLPRKPPDLMCFRPLEANKRDKWECWITGCRGNVSLSKCAACQVALYCSIEHHKKAWPRHKEFCKWYAQADITPRPETILKTFKSRPRNTS